MDLIECKKCRSQISTNSKVCPSCGASSGGPSDLIPKLLIVAVIVITVFVILFVI